MKGLSQSSNGEFTESFTEPKGESRRLKSHLQAKLSELIMPKRGGLAGILVAAVSGLAAAVCLAAMSAMTMNRAELVAKSARSFSTTASQRDLKSYFHDQTVIASGRHPIRRHQKGKIVIERDDENSYAIKSGAPPQPKSLSGKAASSQLRKYFSQPHVGPGGGKLQVTRVGFETAKQSAAELKSECCCPSFPCLCEDVGEFPGGLGGACL